MTARGSKEGKVIFVLNVRDRSRKLLYHVPLFDPVVESTLGSPSMHVYRAMSRAAAAGISECWS